MPEPMLKMLQLLSSALMLGVVAFAAVVVALGMIGQFSSQPDLLEILGPAVAAAWIGGFIAQMLLWTSQRRSVQREWAAGTIQEHQLAARYQQLLILRFALMEGAAIFGVVTTFLTGSWLPMAAAAASLLVMAAIFPTRGRFEDFCADAKRGA
jgi:hypothetical protein